MSIERLLYGSRRVTSVIRSSNAVEFQLGCYYRNGLLRTTCLKIDYSYQNESTRTFVTSTALLKKGGKGARAESQHHESAGQNDAAEDPFDFSILNADIEKAHSHVKAELSKLRTGGRFNPETLENIRINVVKGSNHKEELADLAQVVPRGRVLNVLVGDKEHVKAISTAIQAANLNLTPQQDPQNPTQLNINLPPPTTESRRAVVDTASKLADAAQNAIKNGRGAQVKRFRGLQLSGGVRPDDLRMATAKMEKVVQDAAAAVKKTFESAKKVLEG